MKNKKECKMSQNKNKNSRQQFSEYVDKQTAYYQKKYNFEYNSTSRTNAFWNNEGDAFKHVYMQADLSFKFGRPIASIPGYYHEIEGILKKHSWNEKNMDLWNNKIGRRVGRELQAELMGKRKLSPQTIDDMIAEKIMQKMRNGELITSPDDPRARTLIEKFKNNSKIPKNWQEYLNTPKDFSKLQSSKLDELKTPTVEGVGNNTALVDNSELLVQYPAPIINTSTNWLSTLGQTFSTTASLQIAEEKFMIQT